MNGSVSGSNRPTGVDEKDSLKDFHQALAVQATSQQIAEFQAAGEKYAEAAQAELQALSATVAQGKSRRGVRPFADALDQALENARSATKKFQEGFSAAQKSGLKDIAKRLAKADSDLDQEQKKLDQSLDAQGCQPRAGSPRRESRQGSHSISTTSNLRSAGK